WFHFHILKIDQQSAAPLLTIRGGMLIGRESIERHSQVRPERSLPRIETLEEIALQRARQETLRQVLGFLVALVPFHPYVFVNRLPIERHNLLERVIRQRIA